MEGGGGVKPRSPKGRAAARGLDAVSGLPTHFHASGRHFTQIRKIRSTQSKISLDSDHGIYRDWTGARTPGVERRMSLEWRCSTEQVSPTQCGGFMLLRRARRMEANLYQATGMMGAILTAARSGKALSDKPALEKLWGGRRRLWHLHRLHELMEIVPWPKSMISAEA